MYRLKKGVENFQVVDGEFAGRKFEKGKSYKEEQVPPQEKKKFEKVPATKKEEKEPPATKKTGEKSTETKDEKAGDQK